MGSDQDSSLLRALLLIVRDDDDEHVRLLSAQALQSIVLFNEDALSVLRSQHSLLMFNCLGTLFAKCNSTNDEVRKLIKEMLGLDLSRPTGKSNASTHADEDGAELCAVCFTVGLRCQRGGPQMLPCGHTFHAQCISDWFHWETKCGRGRTCPLCRGVASDQSESPHGDRGLNQRQNSVARLRTAINVARAVT